jgi:hypothetical protein
MWRISALRGDPFEARGAGVPEAGLAVGLLHRSNATVAILSEGTIWW